MALPLPSPSLVPLATPSVMISPYSPLKSPTSRSLGPCLSSINSSLLFFVTYSCSMSLRTGSASIFSTPTICSSRLRANISRLVPRLPPVQPHSSTPRTSCSTTNKSPSRSGSRAARIQARPRSLIPVSSHSPLRRAPTRQWVPRTLPWRSMRSRSCSRSSIYRYVSVPLPPSRC